MTKYRDVIPGARAPRFNPEFVSAKRIERGPLVRETSTGCIKEKDQAYRRSLIGLPPGRFDKD